MKFKRKLMTQIWEKGKKPNSGLHFRQNFGSPNFFVDFISIRCYASLYAISKKTFDPNSVNWPKPSYWTWFKLVEPKFQSSIFFVFCFFVLLCFVLFLFKNLAFSVTRSHVQLSPCTNIRRSLMIESWANFVTDGPTHRRKDRQTDKSDFIRRCPTDFEHSTS